MYALAPSLRRTSGGDGVFALGIEIDADAIDVNSPEKTAVYVHERIFLDGFLHQIVGNHLSLDRSFHDRILDQAS